MSQPLSPPAQSAAASAARAALLVSALALLGGCQALGNTGGVMPASDVGPPPSLRGSFPNQSSRQAAVDEDGKAPLATAPTRRLDLPKSAGGPSRTSEVSERRIRREDLEGGGPTGGGSGGISPALTPGGGVGVGGKF